MDILNFAVSWCQTENSLNMFETQDQIVALIVNCFLSGACFGFIFSFMDLEDKSLWTVGRSFFFEERICAPIGVVSGMVSGFVNEILRANAGKFILTMNSNDDPFDTQI
jgi:hypothetical protein